VLGCSGAGNSTAAKVSGKITYNGKAVPAGSVAFYAPEGGFYNYQLQSDGTYSGTDLPAGGELVVTVETETANPKKAEYGRGKEGGNPSDYEKKMRDMGKVPSGPSNPGEYVKIPAKYAKRDTSPLKVTLSRGDNRGDF